MVGFSDARKGLVCSVLGALLLAGLLALGCGGSSGGESPGEKAGPDGGSSDGTSGVDVATPDSAGGGPDSAVDSAGGGDSAVDSASGADDTGIAPDASSQPDGAAADTSVADTSVPDAEDGSLADAPGSGALAQVTIGPLGGQLLSADGSLLLVVPPGAVATDTVFSVQEVPSPAPGNVGRVYDLEPSGVTFAVPLSLMVSYAGVDLGGVDPQGLSLASYDPTGWDPVASAANVVAETIGAQVSHFTLWGFYPAAPSGFVPGSVAFQVMTGPNGLQSGDDVGADLYAADGSLLAGFYLNEGTGWPGGESPPYVFQSPFLPVSLRAPVAKVTIFYSPIDGVGCLDLSCKWDLWSIEVLGADASGNSPFCLLNKGPQQCNPQAPSPYDTCDGDGALNTLSSLIGQEDDYPLKAGAGCASIQSITVAPNSVCMANDPVAQLQFTATANYGPGNGRRGIAQDVTQLASWSLTPPSAAAISSAGLVSQVTSSYGLPADVTVTATGNGLSGTSTFTVASDTSAPSCCFDPSQTQTPTTQASCAAPDLQVCDSATSCDNGGACTPYASGGGAIAVGSLTDLSVCVACPSGQTRCSGVCEDLHDDPANCGGCGTECSAPNSTCCAGGCTDTSTDSNNCGGCGLGCRSPQTCVDGGCSGQGVAPDGGTRIPDGGVGAFDAGI